MQRIGTRPHEGLEVDVAAVSMVCMVLQSLRALGWNALTGYSGCREMRRRVIVGCYALRRRKYFVPRYPASDRDQNGNPVEGCPRKALAFVVLLLVFLPRSAYAYIDPGTGSYIFQVIISLLLGVMFSLRRYWKTLWDKLTHRSKKHDQ